MTLRIQSVLALLSTAFCSYVASTPAVAAPEPVAATIEGTATFERRSTIVPLIEELGQPGQSSLVCFQGTCPQPKPYWTLVVTANGVTYELNQPIDMGSDREPEDLTLSGTEIRPGEHIVLTGEIESYTSDYAVISKVDRVSILPGGLSAMNLTLKNGGDHFMDVWDPRSEGWTCRGSSGASRFETVIWYGANPQGPTGGSYHMRVAYQADDSAVASIVADVQNLSIENHDMMTVYYGVSNMLAVRLAVSSQDGRVFALPAELKMQKSDQWGNAVEPMLADVAMICNPSRYR